ncbi:hypothetical protein EPA93_11430 [Ktedonosporobacter rubrisoli]|uniref:HTH luxR-type domain-containing protein n=1 Tax=Ktedonosporobacter rubrisoli TaxID=2509675 RepID=A0A4P6JNB1_KTERU|nr:LuxR C-terminal-related transcriptional regulator [Ktedonosporobacter rubrisoli]QBD76580.1 hypothetical protein EPA93_11430 [Ktedonosporobacter rubrisoli]
MPKQAQYHLHWSPAKGQYELWEQNQLIYTFQEQERGWWFSWLGTHSSFSFQGKQGKLTLLKEPRARGTVYWYAYRSHKRRTVKQYAGRTSDLSPTHLEEIASSFAQKVSAPAELAVPVDKTVATSQNYHLQRDNKKKQSTNRQESIASPPLSSPTAQPLPLLQQKFQPPLPHISLIERKALLQKLDTIRDHKLTLITAPAGFGKTTAISQWMERNRRQEHAQPVAWLSLEQHDNDLLRFWRYLAGACQSLYAEPAQASYELLATDLFSFEIPSHELILTLLLNDIVRHGCHGILILDDYHLITDIHIHEMLTFSLDHLPPQLHMVLIGRSTPSIALAGLRSRGDLYEIQTADLRFSLQETTEFLQRLSAPALSQLPPTLSAQISTRLEGWAAGLRLLALSLQGSAAQQDLEHILMTFTGEQRAFQDYFLTEVLRAQSAERQDFLLRTSMLDRLTAEICNAVTKRSNSQLLLEEIERAGIFLEALDQAGIWYRYHALFAEAMQLEARRRLGEDVLHNLALRASQWYAQQGMHTQAVEAAFQAEDTARAAKLIEDILIREKYLILSLQSFQQENGFHTLRRWLTQLPESLLRKHPILFLGYAAALLFTLIVERPALSQGYTAKLDESVFSMQAFWATIEHLLQMAEEEFRAIMDGPRLGQTLAFRALIAREQGNLREAISYAEKSLNLLTEEEAGWYNLSLNVIGMGKIAAGQLEEAKQIFLELYALCEMLGGKRAILRAHTVLLNTINYEQGKLRQSAEYFRQMLAEAREDNDEDDIAHASLFLARLSYEWNDMQSAEEQAQEALNCGRILGNEEFEVQASLVLAHIEHARGETERARQRCRALLVRFPATSQLRTRLNREIQMTQVSFSLDLGDVSSAELWQSNLDMHMELPLIQREQEELLAARCQLVQGHTTAARNALLNLLTEAQQMGHMRSALRIQAALVLAWLAAGNIAQTRETLQTLLSYAHTEGYVRLFLDSGESMIRLLRVSLPQLREQTLIAYTHQILKAAAPTTTPSTLAYTLLAEPLSAQEERVLRELLAGRTNPEIARKLIISINTVKAHLKSIYRKLHVETRQQACEAARKLEFR